MTNENPYKTPTANVDNLQQDTMLAGRGERFGAAMIDGIIGLIVALPFLYQMGMFDYISKGLAAPYTLTLFGGVFGFVMFILIHGYFLKKNGQTVGKKLVGIRISDLQEGVPALGRVVGLRYLPITLAGLIPFVGQVLTLIDVLFIFREDRRCVHDLLAGTLELSTGTSHRSVEHGPFLPLLRRSFHLIGDEDSGAGGRFDLGLIAENDGDLLAHVEPPTLVENARLIAVGVQSVRFV